MATLAVGLRDDSRVKMEISGQKVGMELTFLAAILDGINTLAWMQSKDGAKGRNRPKSISKELAREEENDIVAFDSLEAFKAAWNGN